MDNAQKLWDKAKNMTSEEKTNLLFTLRAQLEEATPENKISLSKIFEATQLKSILKFLVHTHTGPFTEEIIMMFGTSAVQILNFRLACLRTNVQDWVTPEIIALIESEVGREMISTFFAQICADILLEAQMAQKERTEQ